MPGASRHYPPRLRTPTTSETCQNNPSYKLTNAASYLLIRISILYLFARNRCLKLAGFEVFGTKDYLIILLDLETQN